MSERRKVLSYMPPSLQMEQVGGFALYMAKAVLNGRGDELVDLARSNLFR